MAKKNSKPMFHKPQKTSQPKPIPTTMAMKFISVAVIIILLGLTAFAIYLAVTQSGTQVALAQNFVINASLMYLLLPIVGWIIVLCFRFALRAIPLEMWRLPAAIRNAAIKSQGKYLKLATLLIQLETILVFWYIIITIYFGHEPSDLPMIIWVLVVAATIIVIGRYDYEQAN